MEAFLFTGGTYLVVGAAVWVLSVFELRYGPYYAPRALSLAKGWAFAWPLVLAWVVRDIIRDAEERLEGK